MIPVHLPREEHWFLLVISIFNLYLYIYDSSSCHAHTYKTVVVPNCPKQMNTTCFFAKRLISEECNYYNIKLDNPRDEMAGDLLNLATAGTNKVQDLFENLQWIFDEDATKKLPLQVSVIVSLQHPKTERNCLFHVMSANSLAW